MIRKRPDSAFGYCVTTDVSGVFTQPGSNPDILQPKPNVCFLDTMTETSTTDMRRKAVCRRPLLRNGRDRRNDWNRRKADIDFCVPALGLRYAA